jgi:uncharacterized membrane protein (UPF0127 family)/CheY-like chemotaxis protein
LHVSLDERLIVNLTRGAVVCERTAIADRPRRRMRGLLGRQSLPAGEGMLLQPAPSIHTAFMHFPIDVVFMDGTLRVVKLVEGMPPWRAASARRAWGVLELAAGEVASRGIEIGDQLGVVEITDTLGAVDPDAGWDGGDWTSGAREAVVVGKGVGDGANRGLGLPPREDAAGATRVLVVGTDRRFRSVAAALLTRRGCAVTLHERMTDVAELAKQEAADVVILDAGSSLTAAAFEVGQIEKLDPPVGVVVVGDVADESLSAMPVLARWGPFDGLFNAVEQSRPSRGDGVAVDGDSNPALSMPPTESIRSPQGAA